MENNYTITSEDCDGSFIITSIEELPDVKLFTPTEHIDDRGWFAETFVYDMVSAVVNPIVQHNHSHTKRRGTVRGLHFQNEPFGMSKIVRCTQGSIFDVVVDVRPDSKTKGKWIGAILSRNNAMQILVPVGFAHGFQTLEHNCDVQYIQDEYYNSEYDRSISPLDPALEIGWPFPIEGLSDKDLNAPVLEDCDIYF